MKLLVDVGNSRVKWAFGSAAGFVAQGETPRHATGELGALLDAARRPTEIRVANVAGAEAGTRVAASLRQHYGIAPVFALSAATGAGVRSGYSEPSQLGVDRWLALCAAFSRYRAALCVVDAGTATTVDIVNAAGLHQGGLILPGITLMQSALLGGTGDLARLSAVGQLAGAEVHTLGRDTAAAIRNAALQATAALVRDCLARLGEDATATTGHAVLVLTGGAAPLLNLVLGRLAAAGGGAWRGYRVEYRPQIVLEGLALDPPCFRVAA